MITAKLASIRWRKVQFFTVSPLGPYQMEGSIAEGVPSFTLYLYYGEMHLILTSVWH